MQQQPDISVVVPVYRGEACLRELHSRLSAVLENLVASHEIVLVNDCSPQNDWKVIEEIAAEDPRVKGVNLARNFGEHFAITAGLDHARGDWVVVMACDLQDRPEEIPQMYGRAREGYDVVFARRVVRSDGAMKIITSKAFNRLFNFFSDIKIDPATSNFSILSRIVVENFCRVREQSRSFGLIVRWLGFRVGYVDIQHDDRFAGDTSYTFTKSLALAVDAVVSQSTKPLRLSIRLGFLVALISALYGLWLITRKFAWGIDAPGWTSVMVSLYLIGGLIFANMGVIGLYLGKNFEEAKKRPLYVVRETVNLGASEEPVQAPPIETKIIGVGDP